MNANFLELTESREGIACIAAAVSLAFPISGNLCAKIAGAIAHIVNKGSNYGYMIVAAFLLHVLVIVPSFALAWCCETLSPFDFFFDLLILFFCFEIGSIRKYAKRTATQLRKKNLNGARDEIKLNVLRDTGCLSEMGVAKATCESLPLNALHGFFAPFFWYLLLGPYAAFASSLISIMSKATNRKLPVNYAFGKIGSFLWHAVSAFPAIFMLFCLIPGKGMAHGIAEVASSGAKHPGSPVSGWLIGFVGAASGAKLGGPRFYSKIKVRFPSYGGMTDPAAVHIDVIRRRIGQAEFLALAGALCFRIFL